jgi:hypothetical protein
VGSPITSSSRSSLSVHRAIASSACSIVSGSGEPSVVRIRPSVE